eukprot:CAMPEP_0202862118 /NCGR_PEP_ID=MMETSP1391-20130828/3274_1 /ASSEMBLY_ACC=CAM_ASM_000867 /TAXON_ID=1034604 /ORGANISM="Chlamydomonas leiostraca, Strain SAG 11-49" /LENGTH=95 /DNA_ID=CAMNT_0049541609 /DNA_START=106 /DNA_END=393 /DNA_ORIENTATION=+
MKTGGSLVKAWETAWQASAARPQAVTKPLPSCRQAFPSLTPDSLAQASQAVTKPQSPSLRQALAKPHELPSTIPVAVHAKSPLHLSRRHACSLTR